MREKPYQDYKRLTKEQMPRVRRLVKQCCNYDGGSASRWMTGRGACACRAFPTRRCAGGSGTQSCRLTRCWSCGFWAECRNAAPPAGRNLSRAPTARSTARLAARYAGRQRRQKGSGNGMRCSTEPQEKAAYAAAPAPRFSTHLAFSKPLKNQAFSAPASRGEYRWSTRCEITGSTCGNRGMKRKKEAGFYRQRDDGKAAGKAAAATD